MNKKVRVILVSAFLFINITFLSARGDEPTNEELLMEIKKLKSRVAELERKLASQNEKVVKTEKDIQETKRLIEYTPGEGITVEAAGLNIGASGTFVFQGTPNANNAGSGEDSIFDASYKANIEIEKVFGDWGLAFIELEAGDNDSVEGELNLFSNVNRAASDTDSHVDINKLWYEHYLFDKQLAITVGKIEAADYMDQNEYAYDECAQFLSYMFRNSPAVEFPAGNGPGLRVNLCCKPIQLVEFDFGYFEADADWDDIFDHAFYVAQVNLKPAGLFGIDVDQWNGNYRFYSWINDRYHTKLVDEGEPVSDENKELNYGFGLSCDQMITDVFGIFGRFGWQRPDIIPVNENATIECTWSAGAQMTGKFWARENDVLAFAIGQVFPSEEYKDAGNPGSAEGHIETYYSAQLNECLAISPDLQVIWNPNGIGKSSEGDDDAIFVYGLRCRVDF